jgi:hypothetical protein
MFLMFFLLTPCAALAQDGSFVSAGVELHYRAAGNGTPAVFLSGGPGFTVDYMVPVGDFLPAGYLRIYFEQRGTPWIEQPDDFRRAIAEFLAKPPTGGTRR